MRTFTLILISDRMVGRRIVVKPDEAGVVEHLCELVQQRAKVGVGTLIIN